MLTNITLENFKAFQKLDDLKIKPITILCGTNSCGKSSILQSILLLKQTLENKNPNHSLLLNNRFVRLGLFQDILFRKNQNNEMSFKFRFNLDREEKSLKNVYLFIDQFIDPNYDFYTNDGRFCIEYEVTLKMEKENYKENNNFEHLNSIQVKRAFMKISALNPYHEVMLISAVHKKDNNYFIEWKRTPSDISSAEIELKFSNLFPDSFTLTEAFRNSFVSNGPFLDFNSIYRFKQILGVFFHSYSYIGPLRGEPERRYIYENDVMDIGIKGENAAYLYFTGKNKQVSNHFFYQQANDSFKEIPDQTLHSALQKWFDLMKIPNFEAELNNKIIYLNMEASAYDETRVGIADVGFGVSQIFPIILEGLRLEKGGTLMLEQPEIHLHPNLQMQMADYFISLALSGKQVLVETHSDHVINRLVRRIVEDETLNLKDLVGIYFIKPSENGSVYEEINIDDTKGITNWPPDFFDQTANEQMKIMQAGLKKRKSQRVPANGKP
jgi:predicted ATPase